MKSSTPKSNAGSSQSSGQIHNDLHLRSPEGQGPAHTITAYWPTLPSRSFLLPASLRPIPPASNQIQKAMEERILWTWREVLLVPELWVLQYSSNLLPQELPVVGVRWEIISWLPKRLRRKCFFYNYGYYWRHRRL